MFMTIGISVCIEACRNESVIWPIFGFGSSTLLFAVMLFSVGTALGGSFWQIPEAGTESEKVDSIETDELMENENNAITTELI